MSKPNILLIEVDQLAAFVLSIYRPDGQAITPNLDALAANGVVFENAYCNSPLCCPSRASKFAGSLPSTHKVWGNGSEFRAEIPTMMHFMKSAGYRTVVSGKTHFIGPDQLHGFDKRLTTDMYPSGFDWSIDWKPHVEHRLGTSTKKLDVSGLCRTNNQILYDTEVQFRAIEFLRYEALNKPETPFFLHVSFTQPHEAYQSIPKYWDRYDGVEIAMPSIPEDADPHAVTRWLAIHHGIDRYPPDEATIRASRRAYYAMISHLDDYLGEIVDELKLLDLYDDTIIVFCSDHGDMMGERNMWFKRTFYEGSLQVPLMFHNPKRFASARISKNVSLADLCPTFAQIAGAKSVSDRFGSADSSSFLCLLDGRPDEWKDEIIAEYFGPGVEEPWLCIRRGEFKYVHTRNHPDLLFNIKNDPNEQLNLITETRYQTIAAELRQKLLERFDLDQVTKQAVANKQLRVFLHDTLKASEGYRWDYQPIFDAKEQYVRGVNSPATV